LLNYFLQKQKLRVFHHQHLVH